MSTRHSQNQQFIIIGLSVLMISLMVMPSTLLAEVMTMSPHKIILNAQGNFEDMQAVIRMPMESGYNLDDYYVILKFNNTQVSEAFDFRYCYVDDNFLASFDRAAVQINPDVLALANTEVVATVEGWYSAVNNDGQTYTRSFSYTDMVEIIDPGNSVKSISFNAHK